MVKGVCVTLIEGCMRGAISYSDFKSKYSSAVLFVCFFKLSFLIEVMSSSLTYFRLQSQLKFFLLL